MSTRKDYGRRLRVGIVTSHPIQYQAPWFRALALEVDLHVYFAQRDTAEKIAQDGYGIPIKWDIDLFSGYESSFLRNVSENPTGQGYSSCDTPEIGSLIKRQRYDAMIVNGWYLKSYLQTVVACWRTRVPVLVRGDSRLMPTTTPRKRLIKRLGYPLLLRAFSACLYVGQRNREYLEHYGVPAQRLFLVPHSVDNHRFELQAAAARQARERIRAELGFTKDEVVALFVGRLVPSKRPADLLSALQLLPRSAKIRAAYVGAGPLETDLRRQAADAGLRVSMLGFRNQTELPAIYAAADFVVLPSDEHETWGLVINEAMACGTPAVVSQAVGCCPDLVSAGQTGESYALGDLHGLAAAIARLLPLLGTETVRTALRAKMANYSVEEAVSGTLRALHSVSTSSAGLGTD